MIVLWDMPFSAREFPIYHLPFIHLQMQATLVSAVYLEENFQFDLASLSHFSS